MNFTKTTEADSYYEHLENMSVGAILSNINKEDKTVPYAVEKTLPQIENLINEIVPNLKSGGRLFYIGARHKWSFGNSRCLRMSTYLWCRS